MITTCVRPELSTIHGPPAFAEVPAASAMAGKRVDWKSKGRGRSGDGRILELSGLAGGRIFQFHHHHQILSSLHGFFLTLARIRSIYFFRINASRALICNCPEENRERENHEKSVAIRLRPLNPKQGSRLIHRPISDDYFFETGLLLQSEKLLAVLERNRCRNLIAIRRERRDHIPPQISGSEATAGLQVERGGGKRP
jgi:hypothetical protein